MRHGGYYLVTQKLAEKFPDRVMRPSTSSSRTCKANHITTPPQVHDFPPDETSLIGAGVGFAQAGLLPVVEIPYAKYLDCGADMFFEAVISHWLSKGRNPNGMIFRLQGFDRGVFGGNFHTHNRLVECCGSHQRMPSQAKPITLPLCFAMMVCSLYLPPGLDVVAFSNGADYARGFRHAVAQVCVSCSLYLTVPPCSLNTSNCVCVSPC